MFSAFESVGIVGAGAMGRGIAQIAAQTGYQVMLMDSESGVADQARTNVVGQ